jgi:hypothetical protein
MTPFLPFPSLSPPFLSFPFLSFPFLPFPSYKTLIVECRASAIFFTGMLRWVPTWKGNEGKRRKPTRKTNIKYG